MPRKRTKPPIHAKSLTPKNASQSIAARAGRGGSGDFSGGGSLTGCFGNAGSGIGDRGGSGGGTADDETGLGARGATGADGAASTSPRPDSNSSRRRPSWRTAFLSLCSSTAPIRTKVIGTNKTANPMQTDESIRITALPRRGKHRSQSCRAIKKFPRQAESIRQMSRQGLHTESLRRVMPAEE